MDSQQLSRGSSLTVLNFANYPLYVFMLTLRPSKLKAARRRCYANRRSVVKLQSTDCR